MLLELRKIKSGYGKHEVIHGVDLSVAGGEIVAIIGPNGAGKSTLLKSIFGLVDRFGGAVKFEGKDIAALKPSDVVKQGICFVHQGRNIFPNMSVGENLRLGSFLRADKEGFGEDLERVYKLFPALAERKGEPARLLSGGQQQMLGMARALVLKPKLLLLDEPSLGLAPKLKDEIFAKIKAVNTQGTSLLIVEQNVQKALENSHRTYVLSNGMVEFEGDSGKILRDKRLRKLYLG